MAMVNGQSLDPATASNNAFRLTTDGAEVALLPTQGGVLLGRNAEQLQAAAILTFLAVTRRPFAVAFLARVASRATR